MLKRTLFFSNPARLSLKKAQLHIELDQENIAHTVPLEDVGLIILEHPQLSITHALIQNCMHHKVGILTCDEKHMPHGFMLPLEGHVELQERYRQQLETSVPLKKQLWAQTVQQKIINQSMVLSWRGKSIPRLDHLITEITSGDGKNCEGQAAAIYWPALFDSFPYFIRDRYGEPPNAFLNYGYAILRAMTARALVSTGLLLAIGNHHRNKYNAFCLADDMMEPYRPFVDALVCRMMDNNMREPIDVEGKKYLLNIAGMDVEMDGKTMPLWNAIIRSAQSLQRCYAGLARKLSFPEYAPGIFFAS